ncbi:MAG: ATP-binding protein [Clostridia bacterium]|nr:ATP-binding protein [Clostridia bacterium]
MKDLKTRIGALTVFREFLCDEVIASLYNLLDKKSDVCAYSDFVSKLYNANGGDLSQYVRSICENSSNVYVRMIGKGESVPGYIEKSVEFELDTLQMISDLSFYNLTDCTWASQFKSGGVDIRKIYLDRARNIGRYGFGIYAKYGMFYLDDSGEIIPVKNPDKTRLSQLVDYEYQRGIVIDNTKALLCGKPAANILLTGDAGTGKSATVKAVCNELFGDGLRIIEIRKDQLHIIPQILDELAENPLKFVLFIDDLSFLKDDDNFNALKAVLEGSVSAKSRNVVIYATSNRRHIIKEKFSDRDGDEVHINDTLQETVSLSERFGIHISFDKPDKKTFLHIVRSLASQSGLKIDDDELELKAERFALQRGGRSARLARQFVDGLLSE